MIFNLAVEPLIRRAKAQTNGGFKLYNTCLKVTAYADDIAVVCSSPTDLQYTINGLNRTASTLGLLFNVGKCSLLLSLRARPALQQGFPSTVCRFGHLKREAKKLIFTSPWEPNLPIGQPQTSERS
jgi:hypothetical protein